MISDLLDKDGFESALRYLVAMEMDAYVIQVLCPEELQPEIAGDLKLVDCEDQDEAEISVSRPLLDRYQRTLAAFIESVRHFCNRRGMAYALANTQLPVEKLISGYLRQQGLIR